MAKSGLKHIDVGNELTKTEWESEESHELTHGTGFPSSPVERQLFYRDDEHKWYIYTGSTWTELTAAGAASTFLGLTDTPSSYSGQAGKYARVNSGEDALEFDTPTGAGDMQKSVYDTDDDGVVDNSEKLEGSTKAQVQDHSPKTHATTHENAGADEINVAGLSGELADAQPPKAHSLGGSEHNADTLANLNSKVSDATLDDSGDPRDPNAHKSSHENGGADEINVAGLSGELADNQPPKAHKASHENGGADEMSIAGLSGESAELATHKGLTTGVHGAGSNYLALFGQQGIVVTRFVPKTVETYLWRGNPTVCNSSFEAQIFGTPTATSVVYDNAVREDSLQEAQDTQAQWGKVILHNISRGNSRKITDVDLDTNTITTESSSDDWADNDIITIGSQTCVYEDGYSYSRLFDIDISPQVPSTAKAVLVDLFNSERSGSSSGLQNSFGVHPFETFSKSKFPRQYAAAAYQVASRLATVPVNSQKICAGIGVLNDVNASGMYAYISLVGYWE